MVYKIPVMRAVKTVCTTGNFLQFVVLRLACRATDLICYSANYFLIAKLLSEPLL